MSWKFEIITAPDELKSTAFVDEWTNMITTAQCSHVFFHPALVKAWIDTYSPLRHLEPFVVKATDGVNKAPLRQELKAGVTHFSKLTIGDTEIAWHLGFTFRGSYYYYMPAGNIFYSGLAT